MTTQRTTNSDAGVRLLTSNAMHGVLDELLPEFERTSGYAVSVSYDPAQIMMKRIRAGETADLAILGQPAIDELAKLGRIMSNSRRTLARCRVGVAVRAGAPKPDIDTVDAFKRALLAAKSVAYTQSGASGIHFSGLIERLGVAAEVKAKAVTRPGGLIAELVASGEAEIAVQQIPELMAVGGVELVGALPQELQLVTVVCAGIFADAKQLQAAKALLDFLSTPDAARVMKTKGQEPV